MWHNVMQSVEAGDGALALAVGALVKHGTLISGNADNGMVWAMTAVQEYLPCSMLDMLEGDSIDEGVQEEVRRAVRMAFASL
jgi:hypothetical protein